MLNLVWLVAVAILLLANWRAGSASRGRLLGLGAILCIAMLLFPVISASDDLHPGFDLSDEAAWRHEKRGPGVVALIALVLCCLTALIIPPVSSARLGDPFLNAVPASGFVRLDLARGPPATL